MTDIAARGRAPRMALLVLFAFALVPVTAPAQEPVSIASIAAGYFGKETYCETGKWGMGGGPQHGSTHIAFSRCAHRDGRFKVVEYVDRAQQEVLWSDSRKYYRHSPAANFYREAPLDDDFLRSFPANRSELYPIYLSRLFNQYSPNARDRGSTGYLQSFKASSALSTPQHSVFERNDDENGTNSERLWVRNADKAIVRYEGLRNGVVAHFAQIASQEVDRPLTDAELSHSVPFFTRYSFLNSPATFIIGLFVAAGFGGAFLWVRSISRAASVEDFALKRRRLWQAQFWILGAVAFLLACLAVLAIIIPGSGHPSGLFLVLVLAGWCAIGFALAACFTLMSYPVEWLLSRTAARSTRAPPS